MTLALFMVIIIFKSITKSTKTLECQKLFNEKIIRQNFQVENYKYQLCDVFLCMLKELFKVDLMINLLFGFNDHIIHVNPEHVLHLVFEYHVHHPLICCTNIFTSKGHYVVVIVS